MGLPRKKKRLRLVYGILVGLLIFAVFFYVLLPGSRGSRAGLGSSSPSRVLCFVLDNAGESVAAFDPFGAGPSPLMVSVPPFFPESRRYALAAAARGKILRQCSLEAAKILGLVL